MGNTVIGDGGGIYNFGAVTVIDSNVSENTARYWGGGIHNWGTATVTGSIISKNTPAM